MTNLTTLASAKQWIGDTDPRDDDELTALIGQASGVILAYLNRPNIFRKTYTEKFTGSRSRSRMLRNYPVLSVASVSVCGQAVPTSDGNSSGYWVDAADDEPPGRLQTVHLNGYAFGPGLCEVIYSAGYYIAAEPQTAAASVGVDAPYGIWGVDGGVTYANGTVFTAVTASPAQGQYSVLNGTYRFNAADVGQAVLISYSYIPAAIQQACNQIVGEQYKYSDRIGQKSKTLGGQETTAFNLVDMPAYIKTALAPYRRMVPV